MKSFNEHISEAEAIYPDSYLRNKRLMNLVKQHKDPFKFLLAVIDQMNRGKLNLKRIGAASTREVAALWNDFNDKKIPASMVEQVDHLLTEAKYPPRVKGWGNAKTGKLALTPIKGKYKPYHQEFASNNLNKLGLKEKDAIKYLDDAYTPPTDNHTKRLWKNIQDGVVDRDKAFEEFLNKNGWYSIVIDEGTYSIGDYKGGLKKYHKIAVAIDKKFGADSMFQDSSDFFEVGTEDIHNKYDWNNYIKTKKVGTRTEIGSTMAMFRGESMKSFGEFIEETYADSGIGKWMKQSAGGEPGWDRYGLDGEVAGKCGDSKEGEPYAACLSPEKAKKLGKKGIASFVRRKRAAQKKAGDSAKGGESSKGQKTTLVKTKANEETKNVPDDKALWARAIAKAKSKFDVWPSAYGSAWASKWYKEQGGTWSVAKESIDEKAEYEGRKVTLNKPFRTPDGPKKFAVYVKNDKGNVVVVRFGDPNMDIKRDSPERRKAFRSRHSCDDDPGPKWKARYWSCYQWRDGAPVAD